MTTKGVLENFAQDLPLAKRRLLAATQGPTNGATFGAKLTNAAWKTKRTWYVVASNDRMMPRDLERKFAKAMNCGRVRRTGRPILFAGGESWNTSNQTAANKTLGTTRT